ncbi:alpha/beta fold hydrolase [Amycolatopsis sp. NPDC049253]|uniref:alpha/beta fold hydrolase n=1 Tax=Amycolatopsis sp. NPDC049253 TaxID=3155274 RepID=UPI003427E41E
MRDGVCAFGERLCANAGSGPPPGSWLRGSHGAAARETAPCRPSTSTGPTSPAPRPDPSPGPRSCRATRCSSTLTPDHGGEHFGKQDPIAYERFRVPTLVIAGAEDPLREPGCADEIAARIPDAELRVYSECGHLPNIEHAQRFVEDLLAFFASRYRKPE